MLHLLNPGRSRARYSPISGARATKVRWYGGARRVKRGVRGKRRNPATGRAALLLKRKGKKSTASKTRRSTVAKSAKRVRAAKKAARTRARNHAKRSRAAKKAARSRTRSRPKSRRRTRRTKGRARTRRSSSRRRRSGRRRSRTSQGRHRPVIYKIGRKYYAGKRKTKSGKRRSAFRGIRLNSPFSLPTLASAKGLLKEGGYALIGFVGVNAVLMGADKVGLQGIKDKYPNFAALINGAIRLLAIPLVAYGVGKVLGSSAQRGAAIGGAFNLVYHGAKDVLSLPAVAPSVPDWGASLLLGYDGTGDFLNTHNSRIAGVADWLPAGPIVPGYGGTRYSGAFVGPNAADALI